MYRLRAMKAKLEQNILSKIAKQIDQCLLLTLDNFFWRPAQLGH